MTTTREVLRELLDALSDECGFTPTADRTDNALAAARAHLAQPAEQGDIERDARRYRWLRDISPMLETKGPLAFMANDDGYPTGEQALVFAELDAAIDAAMGEQPNVS